MTLSEAINFFPNMPRPANREDAEDVILQMREAYITLSDALDDHGPGEWDVEARNIDPTALKTLVRVYAKRIGAMILEAAAECQR